MKLTRVTTGADPVYLTCTECGEKHLSDKMFAALDGAPFTAYYCPPCAHQHLSPEVAPRGSAVQCGLMKD